MRDFYQASENRRTVYAIGPERVIPATRIVEIVSHSLANCPSSFDSRSARVALLFGRNHDDLWQMVLEALRPLTPAESFPATQNKVMGFAAGYGTVLYFEDSSVVRDLQENFPTYKDNFPSWSLQSSGMLQWMVWTSLEMEGLGASLQHYNPLIDHNVRERWNIPADWRLIAQMPFGNVVQRPEPKAAADLSGRLKVFE